MKAVIQRVKQASVTVDGTVTGKIDKGLLILLGIHSSDTEETGRWMAEKIVKLRIFPDEAGKMNKNVMEAGGNLLIVSQFTLYGDARKGNRPSFIESAPPEIAKPLVDFVVHTCSGLTGQPVAEGIFGAMMDVELINGGPVTIILESGG